MLYQASNATYLGRATPRTMCLLPAGRVLDGRTAQKIRAAERGHEGAGARLVALGARPRECPREWGEDGAAWLKEALEAVGARKVRHAGNHRYAFRIGPRRRAVAVLGRPLAYPEQPDQSPAAA
jgi:hypothetical protein